MCLDDPTVCIYADYRYIFIKGIRIAAVIFHLLIKDDGMLKSFYIKKNRRKYFIKLILDNVINVQNYIKI